MEGMLIEKGKKPTPCFCGGNIIFVHERNHKAIQKDRVIPDDYDREEEEKCPSHDEKNKRSGESVVHMKSGCSCEKYDPQKHKKRKDEEPKTKSPNEEGVSFFTVFSPGLGDLGTVENNIVQEHHFSS